MLDEKFSRSKKELSTETLMMRSTGEPVRSASERINSKSGPSLKQNDFRLSSLTWGCTRVTPNPAVFILDAEAGSHAIFSDRQVKTV